MKIYFELQETTDTIQEFNGDSVGTSAADFADNTEGAYIDNDTTTTHPDLCMDWEDGEALPTAIINNQAQTASIIGGSHPVQRPR